MTGYDAACVVAQKLAEHGFTAYLAGGCVRDRLLKREPKDYDIATNATPDEVRRLYRSAHHVGESFGVVIVRARGHAIEVATFRTEGAYSDGRHPDSVEFSDARHDAMRRDFTINGIFEDPATGAVIDFVGGQSDLELGIIRAIGDPTDRLHEDELRMLRAVRFAARFGFVIEPETARAIRDHGPALRGVSPERVGQELRWMLEHSTRAQAVRLLTALELDGVVLDGVADATSVDVEPPARRDATPRLATIPGSASVPLALAAWARDRHGPGPLDPVVQRWRDRLVLSNAERSALRSILDCEGQLVHAWRRLGVAARKRLATTAGFDESIDLLAASDPPTAARVRADVDALRRTGLAPSPFIDGQDLLAMGLSPGPAFSQILDRVYDAQLEGAVADREGALAMARDLVVSR